MKIIDALKSWFLKVNKTHLLAISVIFLISLLVTFSNLGWTNEFIGDDAGVASHYPATHFELGSNMWDSYSFPGRSNVIATAGLLHVTFINILHHVGLTSVMIDRLFYFLIYFISGLGLYLLAFEICSKLSIADKKKVALACLTGAIFYMLNNFTMILLSFPPTSYIYSYMLLPWIFLLYLKDYHVSPSLFKKLLFALLFLLVLSGNPSNTITIVVLIAFYEIFFRKDNKIIHNKKNFVVTFTLILLLSSYIILPTLGNKGNPYGVMASKDIAASIDFNSTLTSLGNLLRFRGHPAQANYIFDKFLLSDKAILANYILLVVAFFALLRKKSSKIVVFLLSSFLIFLFLAKSEHAPLSLINKIIYAKVPLFEMYRASYYKFVFLCIFVFSLLFPLGLIEFFDKVSHLRLSLYLKRLIWAVPIIAVLYGAIPFFHGDVAIKLHKTTIPTEYNDLNLYLNTTKSDFSVLSLPQLASGSTFYWGQGNYFGSGSNPDNFLLGKPVWSNGWLLPNNLVSNKLSFYKNLLGLTDTRYVLLHKDIPEKYSFEVGIKGSPNGQTNYRALDAELSLDHDFTLVKESNFYKLFEINKKLYNEHFFIPQASAMSDKTPANFISSVTTGEKIVPVSSALFLAVQNTGKQESLDKINAVNKSSGLDKVEFEKINPTKYRIRINNATGTFPLVFAESFDLGWKAYAVKPGQNKVSISDTWFKTPISESSHLLVNSYANSWLIETENICQGKNICQKNADGSSNIELIIEFWPQRLFYLGLSIVLATLLICAGLFIYLSRKRKIDVCNN